MSPVCVLVGNDMHYNSCSKKYTCECVAWEKQGVQMMSLRDPSSLLVQWLLFM